MVVVGKKNVSDKILLDVVDLIEKDKETEWNFTILSDFKNCYPSRTNVSCWWCCHEFSTQPLGIPKKYDSISGGFSVVGCFCSLPCIYAYVSGNVLHQKCTKGDLIFMYKKVSGNSDLEIKNYKSLQKAPPKEVLKKFGGKMSIENYRSLTEHDKVETLLSPLSSLLLTCQTLDLNNKFTESTFYNPKVTIPDQIQEPVTEPVKTAASSSTRRANQKRSIKELISFVE